MKKRNILKKSNGLPLGESPADVLANDTAGDKAEVTAKAAIVSGESQIK